MLTQGVMMMEGIVVWGQLITHFRKREKAILNVDML
jgi:hypothetical protein